MVSILSGVWCVVCGMAVVCAAGGLLSPVCVACALPVPVQYSSVLLSCCCWVCGVWWCVQCVVFVWWGILCLLPPRRGGGWGCRGWWGGIAGDGVSLSGRAARLRKGGRVVGWVGASLTIPSVVIVPPVLLWCLPLFVGWALLKWWGGPRLKGGVCWCVASISSCVVVCCVAL